MLKLLIVYYTDKKGKYKNFEVVYLTNFADLPNKLTVLEIDMKQLISITNMENINDII